MLLILRDGTRCAGINGASRCQFNTGTARVLVGSGRDCLAKSFAPVRISIPCGAPFGVEAGTVEYGSQMRVLRIEKMVAGYLLCNHLVRLSANPHRHIIGASLAGGVVIALRRGGPGLMRDRGRPTGLPWYGAREDEGRYWPRSVRDTIYRLLPDSVGVRR